MREYRRWAQEDGRNLVSLMDRVLRDALANRPKQEDERKSA